MARKATDLLDVFRFNEEDADEGSERSKRTGAGRAAKKKPSAGSAKAPRAQGLSLNPRQVVLGASAIALLLVLSFVLGLSTGRGGHTEESTSALSATKAKYYAIRGTLPLVDHTTQKPVDPAAVADVLERDYHLRRDQIVLRPSGDQLLLEVGPFESVDQARAYHRDSGLEMLHLYMADPFRWPEYTPWGGR